MSKNGFAPKLFVVTSTYSYNFVVCVSSTKLVLLLSKQNESNNSKGFAFASFALLRHFHFKLCSF